MTDHPAPRAMQARPPETLDELRALLLAIARGDAPISLGPKSRLALGRILDLSGDRALLSITALAEVLGVNPSTLTRLAHSLGYSGFPALQQVLLSASMPPRGEFYSRQARAALAEGSDTRSRATRLCRENQANIDRFVEEFDAPSFDRAVELIMSAPRVAVHGIRQFHALASFLVYGLRMIRLDVALLDGNSLGCAQGLAMLDRGDVLLSVSCAPYSVEVIEVARAAYERGISTVTITDSANSPLIESALAAIFVAHQSSFISNSIGAFVVAAECLVNACASARPDETRRALSEREAIIERLKIEAR